MYKGRARGAALESEPDPERCPFLFPAHGCLSTRKTKSLARELELDHDGHPDTGFIFPQVRGPEAAVRIRIAGRLR